MIACAAALLSLCFLATAGMADTLKLAVTTSFDNSGLADILLPAIAENIGLDVQLLVVGTGQALRLGEAGDVDAILVHSRQAEDAFIAAGFGTHRREIMYNDFVFIGPRTDPANIASAQSVTQVLQQIASTTPAFVSRGDDSGTHKAELMLWNDAGFDPDTFGLWYRSVGAGMGASLNTATGLDAYILSDRASWLNFGNKGALSLLFSGDATLFNQYSLILINPEQHPHVQFDSAQALEGWLTSQPAADLINGYEIDGEALFVFNAQAN